jgi:leader peptidase (prepilin peptidase)/N-methyltransferase
MTIETLGLVAAIALGLVMGSAVTALTYRIPRGISWVHGRSACPNCGARLGFADLVPVFSWVASRGRCRHCSQRIPFRYPLTELLCAAWAAMVYLRLGPGLDAVLVALWGFLLIALMWIDLDYQLLPDVLTFPGTLIAVAAIVQWPGGVRQAVLGVVMGSGLLWLLAFVYLKIRKVEGMGGGDVKLAAMFGVVLGWKLTLVALFLAALAGSLWGGYLILTRRGGGQTALPFGTLLAPSAMVAFLWGHGWMSAYASLFYR